MRAERRRLQRRLAALSEHVRRAGEEHLTVNYRHRSFWARFRRHYAIQRYLGIPRLAALRVAGRMSLL